MIVKPVAMGRLLNLLLHRYGPQAPSAYSNGPSILEPQIEWFINVMKKMRAEGATRIEPTREAELAWRDQVAYVHTFLASDKVNSRWNGKCPPLLTHLAPPSVLVDRCHIPVALGVTVR